MSDFFWDPLEGKIVYIIQRSRSFCASPSCRPQLRRGLQSLGLAQKDSLLLLMIRYYILNNPQNFGYKKNIHLMSVECFTHLSVKM
jgi:hypothetical protein